jgi:hypothetical protein
MRSLLFALSLTTSLLMSAPSGLTDRFWVSLFSLWDRSPHSQKLPTKEGCGMDPNGQCLSTVPLQQIDEGCGMDPNGRCRTGS